MTTLTKPEYKTPADLAESHAAAVTPESVSPASLIGTWTNIDAATRGLVKVVVAAAGASITVDAFGACTPTPCNWGAVPGTVYAANVSSAAGVAFTANYHFSFKQTIVTAHLDGKYLTVETFDIFTDSSGRSAYYSSYQMKK